MSRKNIAVLDVGSGSLSAVVGNLSFGGSMNIKGFATTNYGGFFEGEFLEPQKLKESVQAVLNLAKQNAKCEITHLYIGVPGEFCSVIVKQAELNFEQERKVSDDDITKLFDSVALPDKYENFLVVNRAPIYYSTDSEERILRVKGKMTQKLSGLISFSLCQKNFIKIFNEILEDENFEVLEFLSEPLCESLYLIPPEKRDSCAVLVDCGFLTTSVAVVMGDGLLDLKSFSLGAGQIVFDLCEGFGIDVDQAEEIRREISFNEDTENQVFEVETDDGEKQINVSDVFGIVEFRFNQIAKMIEKCLDQSGIELPKFTPIYLTGGGISYIEGGIQRLSDRFNTEVVIAKPKNEKVGKPSLASMISLLDLALRKNKNSIGLFFGNLFK